MMNDAIAKVTEIAGQLEEKGEIYMTKKARKRFLSTAGPILLSSSHFSRMVCEYSSGGASSTTT